MALFNDIPKFIDGGNYVVNVCLNHLERWLEDHKKDFQIDLDPDFQREHVWNEEQQIKYVEFLIRGGRSSRLIHWNHPGYTRSIEPDCDLAEVMTLVDGKQRLQACLRFLRNEIPVFGHLLDEYNDPADRRIAIGPSGAFLEMAVNNLQKRHELLRWYLDLNEGGVVHTKTELKRVHELWLEAVALHQARHTAVPT